MERDIFAPLSVEALLKARVGGARAGCGSQRSADAKRPRKRAKKKDAAEEEAGEESKPAPTPPTTGAEGAAAGVSSEEVSDESQDPCEVRDPEYRYVEQAEYDHTMHLAHVHERVHCTFADYEAVSRRSYPSERARPPEYYRHDPVRLVDAITIGCNMEAMARRAACLVPYEALHIVENGDTVRVIERVVGDEAGMLRGVQEAGEEMLFALMTVENATRHPHQAVRDKVVVCDAAQAGAKRPSQGGK
jgi:hypothetical protein